MAGFSAKEPQRAITGINVTPLVDIMLVLLIVFMVTARLVASRGLPMDLPSAASSTTLPEALAVDIGRDGAIEVDGHPCPDDATLLREVRAAQARHPDRPALVRADGGISHRKVMGVLDLLRQAGIQRVAFGTLPAPEPSR